MLYFKHNDLVDRYRVSLKTVHNWIEATKRDKLGLQLHEHNGRTYISNTAHNVAILERQAENGKKYRNTLHHKVATPTPDFYKLYSRKQILDIISNLNIHHEIPRQYNYFDGGAENWDKHAERMLTDDEPNTLKSSIHLLRANFDTIDSLIEGYDRVNIIDIGPGNALPVKELLEHLLEKGVLHRYIALDVSQKMLNIVGGNIKTWFGDKVAFEGRTHDMTYERFDDLIVDDMLDKKAEKTINIALLLGGTAMNFRVPYDVSKVIRGSLGRNDLFIYTGKLDSTTARSHFAFNPKPSASLLSPIHSFIFDLLDVDPACYDVEMGYEEKKKMRYIQVRLKVGLTIKFKFKDSELNIKLDKGDRILLWRVWHKTALEIIAGFEESGFTLLNSSLTKDRQYLLTISGVETKAETEA